MPKLHPRQNTGHRAEAFVDKTVSDAGFIWNGRQRDFGIDGQIEPVDASRHVTGGAVLAQVKGTEAGFAGETDRTFRFPCDADHIDYWLRSGQPVALICVNVRRQEAWWKRLDTWFADPGRRARRVVEFDKATDRFDVDTIGTCAAWCTPVGEVVPRLAGTEELTSNLLKVDSFAPCIYAASTPCRERGDAWERMRSNRAFESGFILEQGQIFSMAPLADGPLAVLCDGSVEAHLTEEWSMTDDPDLQRSFVKLLNFTLRAEHHPELVWHPKKEVVFYQAPPDRSRRKIKGRSKRSTGRSFFMPYYGKDEATKLRYCRHYAAGLYFQRWDGIWYLEINPTYHFTIDGKRDSLFDAELVKPIKRRERNAAVFGLVRAWADFLRGPTPPTPLGGLLGGWDSSQFAARERRIIFSDLAAVTADAVIDEKLWIPAPPAPPPDPADPLGPLLAGVWEDPA